MKFLTGIHRVNYLYYNTLGEGKRSETDGHNTAVKYRGEMSMRAGNTSNRMNECTTPTQEANDQLYQGVIPGISGLVRIQL